MLYLFCYLLTSGISHGNPAAGATPILESAGLTAAPRGLKGGLLSL